MRMEYSRPGSGPEHRAKAPCHTISLSLGHVAMPKIRALCFRPPLGSVLLQKISGVRPAPHLDFSP